MTAIEGKPWLASYPEGTPAEIDPSVYDSLVEIFNESIHNYGPNPAFVSFDHTISFAEFGALSDRFASWLQHEAGLKKGDRIAIMMPNLLQYPVAIFGALKAGLVVVNTNPLYTERELEHQLKDSGARAIVVVEAFAHTVQAALPETAVEKVIVTRFGDLLPFPKSTLINGVIKYVKKMVPAWNIPGHYSFKAALDQGTSLPAAKAELNHDDLAFLQYTGGTTGVAKGAMLSHGNVVSNVIQAYTWLEQVEPTAGKGTVITALPLYHIFALTANCLTFVKLGWKNRLIVNPRDLPTFVKELGKEPFNAITGVNTLFNALLHADGFKDLDFKELQIAFGGGMATQEAVANKWQEVTGKPIIEAYGLTETSPAACINPMKNTQFNGSIGLPISSTDASIRDTETNEALGFNQAGELCLRGPQVMQGYWQKPEETAKSIDAEGWFHTGDIAEMDERGYVRIVDRLKDMILVSGFNVYPNEIEAVVAELPGVLEAGAIGEPDEHSGEVVKVVIVKSDPNLTEQQVLDHCKERLTGYKRPKLIHFVDELPKTNVGKILRRELRSL